jgi:hypothetical protein
MDLDRLRPWIDERHLDERTLAGYRDAFSEDPAKMLLISDFLRPEVASRLAGFLADDAEFSPEYGLYSVDGGVNPERWEAAAERDRFFRFEKLRNVKAEAALTDTALTYMRFRAFVTEPAFRELFEAMSGLALGPSDDFGAHAFHVGDFLLDHDDANKDRRLALVMYLTPGWRSEYGGALRMEDPQGNARRFDASFNGLAVFDTLAGTTHRVEPVLEPAGDLARRTFGGWFPNAPG